MRRVRLGAGGVVVSVVGLAAVAGALTGCTPREVGPAGEVVVQASPRWSAVASRRPRPWTTLARSAPSTPWTRPSPTSTVPLPGVTPTRTWHTQGSCARWAGGGDVSVEPQVTPGVGRIDVSWQYDGDPAVLRYRFAVVPQGLRAGAQPALQWRVVDPGDDCVAERLRGTVVGLVSGRAYSVWVTAELTYGQDRAVSEERMVASSATVVVR